MIALVKVNPAAKDSFAGNFPVNFAITLGLGSFTLNRKQIRQGCYKLSQLVN